MPHLTIGVAKKGEANLLMHLINKTIFIF